MLVSSFPRSGSSWFHRLLADSIPAFLLTGRIAHAPGFDLCLDEFMRLSETLSEPAFVYKTHWPTFHSASQSKFNIDGLFGFVVRDPRDVMLSLYYFNNNRLRARMSPTGRGIRYVRDVVKRTNSHLYNPLRGHRGRDFHFLMRELLKTELPIWKSYLDEWNRPDVVIIRYEDLLADPRAALETFLKRIDIAFKPELIDKAILKWSFHNYGRKMAEEALPQNHRMIRKGESGQWRTVLRKEHLDIVEQIVGKEMNRLGYR